MLDAGTKVKQADVVMLGYPLLYDMPANVRKNDLEIYEKVLYCIRVNIRLNYFE